MPSAEREQDTFRDARERALDGARLKNQLLEYLAELAQSIEHEVPEQEGLLLAKLKSISAADAVGRDYRSIHNARESCRKVELHLDKLADKKLKALELLELLLASKETTNGCSTQSFAALQAAVAVFTEGKTDEFFDTTDYSLLLDTSEEVAHSAALTKVPEACLSFAAGVTALCTDHSEPNRLFLGFTNGDVVRVSVSGPAKIEYPGHLYEVLFVKVIHIKGAAHIASSSRDKCVKITNIATKRVLCCLSGHSGCVVDLCVWNGIVYTTSLDGCVSHWHVGRGTREGDLVCIQDSICATVFVDSSEFFIGIKSGQVMKYAWDEESKVSDQTASWDGHRGSVSCIDYSAQGFLFTGGVDCAAKVWDVMDGDQAVLIHTLSHHADTVLGLAVGAQEVLFTAGADALVCVWDIRTGSLTHVMSQHFHHVTGLCLMCTESVPDEGHGTNEVRYTKLTALLDLPPSMFDNNTPRKQSGGSASGQAVAPAVRYDADVPRVTTPNDGLSQWDGAAASIDEVDVPCINPHSALNYPEDPPAEASSGSDQSAAVNTSITLVTVSNDKTMLVWDVAYT